MIPIDSKYTILEEIEPKYFSDIIRWRNNKALNKYINQPFELTMELEKNWFFNFYEKDKTQKLFVMIDKNNNKPFGTIGYTDYNQEDRSCIIARLIAGEEGYQGSIQLMEGLMTFFDYVYNILGVQITYSHPVKENIASVRLQRRFGLTEVIGKAHYPERLHDSKYPMVEFVGTSQSYIGCREKMKKLLQGFI